MAKHLIVFFSWGRKELTEKSFTNLLENVREQDKLLVIDQEGHNKSFYCKHDIDFLFLPKKNWAMGPVWMFVKHFTNWIEEAMKQPGRRDVISAYKEGDWIPDFINIVESDTIGREGWIDRVEKIFDLDEPIGIATGYDAPEDNFRKIVKGVKIKDSTPAVQTLIRTEHFKKLAINLPTFGHDHVFPKTNKKLGLVVGAIDEITHIGDKQKYKMGFIK